jgi:hypothetical protein
MIKPGDRFQVEYIPIIIDKMELLGKYAKERAQATNQYEKMTARHFSRTVFFCTAHTGNPPRIQAYNTADKLQKAVFTFSNLKLLKKV